MATPNWSVGAVGIFVEEFRISQDPVWGELHVLDAMNTTKHYSGSTGKKGSLSGILMTSGSGSPELATLQGYAESSTARTITSDQGSEGSFQIMKVEAERKQAVNMPYPVYRVRLDIAEA